MSHAGMIECPKVKPDTVVSPGGETGGKAMSGTALEAERRHLAELLEAIQRCVFFPDASIQKTSWPLTRKHLETHKKDIPLFESLSSIKERFAKLQDTLGAAMRHATILSGESADTFLRVLSVYAKAGIIRIHRVLAALPYNPESCGS
jgi:hypothetical protein